MVRVNSTMLPLGTSLPEFDLGIVPLTIVSQEIEENRWERFSKNSLVNKPLLVMVICAHCPFVKHIEGAITNLANDYFENVQFLAISSNSLITHPQDSPKYLATQALKQGWKFPYLLDSEQSFAKDLKAACTPDFYVFSPLQDGEQRLKYRGQLDGSRPGNQIPADGADLREALDSLLGGRELSGEQKPSIGCNIKWHPGQEPSWFG